MPNTRIKRSHHSRHRGLDCLHRAQVIALSILIMEILLPFSFGQPNLISELPGKEQSERIDQASIGHCDVTTGNSSPTRIHCAVIPSDDAYVDNLIPSKAFGDLPVLIVQGIPSVPVSKNYAYLKFDLETALPPELVSSHAKPSNATLRMYVRLIAAFYNASVRVYRAATNDWDEKTLTWNTRPTIDLSEYSSFNVRANGTWAQWNLTKMMSRPLGNSSQISLAAVPNTISWANYVWFDSKDYPYDNGQTTPGLDLTFVEPFLNIETAYPNLPIGIGEKVFHTDANGNFHALVPWGQYQVSAPEIIPQGDGTRAFFVGWSDGPNQPNRLVTVGNNVTLRANYKIQYRLDVNSPYGSTSGSGWYLEKSIANLSVYPTAVPAEGWAGWLGVRYVFEHWTGACVTSQSACTVVMDGPNVTTAVWGHDYAITLSVLIALIVGGTITYLTYLGRRPRRRRKSRRGPVRASKTRR